MIRQVRRALCVGAATATMLLAPAVAQADVIGDWNAIAQAETVLLRPTAHGQSRGIAMVQGAVYDAVNAIDRGYEPYLIDLDQVGAQPWGSQDAAAATAAYRVLRAIVDRPATPGSTRPTSRPWGRLRTTPSCRRASTRGKPPLPRCSPRARVTASSRRSCPASVSTRRLAADRLAGRAGLRSRRLDRQPEAVPDRQPVAVPLEGPEQAHERGLREGVRGGEGDRRFEQHDPHRRPDRRRSLLAVRSDRALEPARTRSCRPVRPRYGRPGSSLRDDQPRCGGRGNRLLERQVLLELLAAEGRNPRGRHGRQPEDVGDPSWESLFAAATVTTPPLGTPPFPDHPSGHGCLTGAVMHTMADFFGTDKVAITVISGRSLNGVPIPPRQFDRFSHVTEEVIDDASGRDPLPHRRRSRNGDREEGRPLAPKALLPAAGMRGRRRERGLRCEPRVLAGDLSSSETRRRRR